jgi:hypothetical protein
VVSSGTGGVVAPVEGMGSLSGIDPGDAGRDMQESDGDQSNKIQH